MATVTGPLMSMDASGQLGKAIVFTHGWGENIVRIYVPTNTSNTVNQQTIRGYFSTSVSAWNALTSPQKEAWTAFAKSHYNQYWCGIQAIIRYGVKYLIDHAGVEPASWVTPTAP